MKNEIEKLKYQISETERKIKEIEIKLRNIVQDYNKNINIETFYTLTNELTNLQIERLNILKQLEEKEKENGQ